MGLLEVFLKVFGPVIDYVATHHRAAAVIWFLLPMSFLVTCVMGVRDWLVRRLVDVGTHETRVERVRKQVEARLDLPEEERRFLCTARAPWQNLSTRFADYKKNSNTVFVGDLNNILELDEARMTLRVEPNVDVKKATEFLVPRGYMLATTLEIGEATLGGLAMAVGMTTASHKYGLLQETVLEYEVIMGDGKVLKVRKDNEHSELYHALPWSHGSLCLLLSLTMQIIPVKPFVELTYAPIKSGVKDYCAEIRRVSVEKDAADFVEATIFSREEAVVMTARFVERPDPSKGPVNHVLTWYKRWFYTHVRDMLASDKATIEYVPTFEYIFRHERAIFWTIKDQLPEEYSNDSVLFRYLMGWLCPPKVQFLKLPATQAIRREMMYQRVYQDIVLPMGTGENNDDILEQAVEKGADLFEVWPILVYPSRICDHGNASRQGLFRKPAAKHILPGTNYAMYFDLGIYGIAPSAGRDNKPFRMVTCSRDMEHFTRKAGGCPFLYATTFMSRQEFGEMLDLTLYEKVRKKYSCGKHFPHVFDKTAGCQSFDWREQLELETQGKVEPKKSK